MSGTGTIRGKVTNAAGAPAANAQVHVGHPVVTRDFQRMREERFAVLPVIELTPAEQR